MARSYDRAFLFIRLGRLGSHLSSHIIYITRTRFPLPSSEFFMTQIFYNNGRMSASIGVAGVEILEKALMGDGLIASLDKPDKFIDDISNTEAEYRLIAYRSGDIKRIPLEEVFKEKN